MIMVIITYIVLEAVTFEKEGIHRCIEKFNENWQQEAAVKQQDNGDMARNFGIFSAKFKPNIFMKGGQNSVIFVM